MIILRQKEFAEKKKKTLKDVKSHRGLGRFFLIGAKKNDS